MGIIDLLQQIAFSLQDEIDSLRDVVMFDRKCGRSWERDLAKFDELLIRKNQTDVIISELEKYYDKKNATKDL